MIPYIVLGISLILDGILTNYLPYLVNDLSLFTPLLTLVAIIIIYPFYRKDELKYYVIAFIVGVLYDLFYTNLIFFNGVLFFTIAYTSSRITKNVTMNTVNLLLETIGMIVLYEVLTGLALFTYHVVPVTVYKVWYKIIHSLLLNVIYVEIVYWILKVIPKKYKKISIN